MIIIELLIIVIFSCVVYTYMHKTKERRKPPGPWGFPFVGHILFLGRNPPKKFLEWKKTYGPMFSIKLGSNLVVVLNEVKLIKAAFSLPMLSGRPHNKIFIESKQNRGFFLTDGPRYSEQRRFSVKTLRDFGVGKSTIEFGIQEEISIFLDNLSAKNKEVQGKAMKVKHVFRFPVINSLWVAVMGKRFDESDPTPDKVIKEINRAADMRGLSVIASLFFPIWAHILCYLGVHPSVNGWRNVHSIMEKLIEEQRNDYVPGQPKHFTDAYFDRIAETKDPNSSFHESNNDQAATTSEIMVGAVDTTTTTLDWFLIYMVREPQIQKKLQQEIDSVIGKRSYCIPSLAHKTQMPYTDAVIQETLRISTVTPLGMLHRSFEDLDFNGYRIPKDTVIVANQYGAHYDPEVWSEPDKFLPERFLTNSVGGVKKSASDLVPFSYGTRVCPGEGISRDQIFLFITSFFQRFTVSCAGKLPSVQGNFGVLSDPNPFELIFTERLP